MVYHSKDRVWYGVLECLFINAFGMAVNLPKAY